MEICKICKSKIPLGDERECCNCETLHCESCSIESSEGWGEYPDENAYSLCSKCDKKE